MQVGMGDLVTGLALVLVIEGALMALFPERLKRLTAALLTQPPHVMRIGGLGAAPAGGGLVWLIRGWDAAKKLSLPVGSMAYPARLLCAGPAWVPAAGGPIVHGIRSVSGAV